MPNPPTAKRRRHRYSLRLLLVVPALFAVACGSWYAVEMRKAAKRRKAIEEIVGMGGEVGYYDADDPDNPFPYQCGEPPKWFSWLRKLHSDERLGNPVYIRLVSTPTSDADLTNLKGLATLQWLWLGDTQVTDAGLIHLEGLTKLQWLDLSGTQVTDAGLIHLKGLTELERLELYDTPLTDAGLVHLKGLAKLQWLDLYETDVSDAGLENLNGLTKLERLDIHDTAVTAEGVEKLQEALPNCAIYR